MFKSIDEYIDWCVDMGYISSDGTPLKCHKCDSKELEEYDEHYMEWGDREEYSVRCKQCGTEVGHWAYGNWNIM